MKNYKDFEKEYIGSSDVANLILAGYKKGEGFTCQKLNFIRDGSYNAYIVEGKDVEIGEHYNKVAEFESWTKIYDDEELVKTFIADEIIVYRAAEMGCIIQLIKKI